MVIGENGDRDPRFGCIVVLLYLLLLLTIIVIVLLRGC